MPLAPSAAEGMPLSRLSGVPGLQFTSSGAGEGRGEELRPARPHLPSQTQEGRAHSRSPPSGGLTTERSARLPAGCGGQGVGLKSFTYRHVRHWEFRGQGSPGPLPQYEGKPNCECERQCTAGPGAVASLLSLGTTRPMASRLKETPHTSDHVGSHGQAWKSFGDKGDRVGRQDLPKQRAGSWEMCNLRTPIIIIVLFFL